MARILYCVDFNAFYSLLFLLKILAARKHPTIYQKWLKTANIAELANFVTHLFRLNM